MGALISNSALIMGLCYIAAGLRFRRPFQPPRAGHHSVLMMLTIAAVLFPSLGSFVTCGLKTECGTSTSGPIMGTSLGIAVVLLVAYAAYLAYGVLGLQCCAARPSPAIPTS